ncbi:DUF4097 family beta strand repeat-containing protein [Kitasatospora aureofaciens]|uniref:DUF4097 family beta strand repeat-containing protein n=1 Tax=Kitasatospora aureofaciens TaxID=1894 RepID=UPI001C463276|nr:DUF4097 family beta strand repeat-containing protein [Kitasatospora aureofaciens]MBV6695936.1 DUF4097 domain-containing protein [Kitasatospora aureofaciens]
MRAARAWRITGTLAVAFVMIMGASQTFAMVANQKKSTEKQYDVTIHKLRLATGSASVRITAGRENHVLVRKNLTWTFREPDVSTTFQGDEMTVGVACRQPLPFLSCGAEIELEVPRGTEVSGAVDSGSVDVADLTGAVRLDATSGALYLRRLSGEIHTRTTSGMVQGTNLTSARVDASATSGSVELDFAKAPHAVDVSTGSGAVTVTVPRGSQYAFSGQAGSGSRSIDAAMANASSPDSIRAEIGSGSLRIGYRQE